METRLIEVPEIMGVREVAEYMDVHTNTIYKLVHCGELPAHRVTKNTIRFYRKEIDQWLRNR